MKFNSALLPLLFAAIFSCVLFSCASHPEKTGGQGPDKNAEAGSSTGGKLEIPTSVLPAGPPTANPYLQTRGNLSAEVEADFREAVVAMQQKQWPQAESQLHRLAATQPKLSGVQLNLGIVYRAMGDNKKAAEAFAQAIKVNPKNIDAYNQLAVLKRETGNFAEAEALYQQALGVWPFHAESHKNIAILYELYLGRPEGALPHYLAYQALLPAPDKQVDSWIADLQRRVASGKKSAPEKNDAAIEGK